MPKIPDKYHLMPFQREGVDFILANKNCFLADSMGLGKTIQSLTACVEVNAKRLLIICPASIVTQWCRSVQEFYPEGINVLGLTESTPLQASAGVHEAFAVVASYNIATTKAHVLRSMQFDFCILDESHFLKSGKAQRTKAILGKNSFIPNCKKTLLMTGTPILNHPIDVYVILKVFASQKLGKFAAYPTFLRHFCGWDGRGAKHTEELGKMLGGFMLRRLKEDVLKDLPDTVSSRILLSDLKLPAGLDFEEMPTRRRIISEAKVPGAIKYVKDKLQTIDKIVLIAYHTNTIKALGEGLKEFNPSVVQGGQTAQQKDTAINLFTEGGSKILLAQISTVGFGIDGLQKVCDTMIFAEIDWSPAVIAQAIDRLRRIGQKNTVFVDYLIAEGTLEEEIELAVSWKKDIIHRIVDKNRHERSENGDMPYGLTHKNFERLPKYVQETVAKAGGSPDDHAAQFTRTVVAGLKTESPDIVIEANVEKTTKCHVLESPAITKQEIPTWQTQYQKAINLMRNLWQRFYL